jgi:hypothetical protein
VRPKHVLMEFRKWMCRIDGQENKYSVLNECSRMLKYNIPQPTTASCQFLSNSFIRSLSLHSMLCVCLLTDRLAPWSRAQLEKPPVAQLLKNFPTFYGILIWRLITAFTRALQLLIVIKCTYSKKDTGLALTTLPGKRNTLLFSRVTWIPNNEICMTVRIICQNF